MNLRANGKKVEITRKIKYLRLLLDKNLTFKRHIDFLKTKLRRTNCLFTKIRDYVGKDPLGLFTMFYLTPLRYGCQIWDHGKTHLVQNLELPQNKAIPILNFRRLRKSSEPLYKFSKIFKLKDLVRIDSTVCAKPSQ